MINSLLCWRVTLLMFIQTLDSSHWTLGACQRWEPADRIGDYYYCCCCYHYWLLIDVNCGNTKLNEDIFVAVVIAILTLKNFGTSTGLEPMASALALQCPNELSYGDERNKLACSQCMGLHSSIGLKILLSKLVSNEVNQKALRWFLKFLCKRIVFRRLR